MDVELVEVRDFLARCAPFDQLTVDQLDRIPAQLSQRYHRRGTVILDAGARNDTLHLIRSGAVEVCDPDGALLDARGEGDCFGYSSLASGGPSRYRMVAVADTLLLEMPRDVLDSLLTDHPQLGLFFGERSERIRQDLASARLEAAGGDALGTPVGELLARDAVTTGPDTAIRDAAWLMTERRVSALLVVEAGRVVGIFTDRDLRSKVVAVGGDTGGPVSAIMTPDPVTVDAGTRAFDATLLQIDRGVHHLPVCEDGAPVGMVTSGDLLRLAQTDPVYLAARIARAPDAEGVAHLAARLPALVGEFVRRGTAPQDIGRVVTATADAATRRLISLAEGELGPPPVAYCWVGLGSQARGELGVASDQDNALILADAAETTPDADRYFAELAGQVCAGLDRSGFPLCPGDVMASTPAWRRTCASWERQVGDWVRAPGADAVLNTQVFLDIRPVHGDTSLFMRVRDEMLARAEGSLRFQAHLARIACEWRPPLGFFRGLVVERRGEYRNTLDLKAGGIAPVVQIARVYALSAGLDEVSTLGRLDAAAGAGVIARADAEDLSEAFRFLRGLTYSHHARQIADDDPQDNHLDPGTLSSADRHRLRAAFRIIAGVQGSLGLKYRVGQM
ncbi:histidine kinase [Dietzia sp. UCD-THP]|uniref:putative nucleotidyltransferase substrate binding domain-containing protein n=1 Tax=Dietzia sp. UCD-THP TaxID=1292020 RepID=UPI00037CA7DF|nr:putative nucleotidyltransferase substrate binding domain-containing protein [Dietzia sp. UCD-THP]EYT63295.1 histidine kinase [Dietzia sp. UCD-THP]